MAEEAAPSLGDFFKAKAKKKVKGSNLNNAPTATKADGKKQSKKEASEEDGWEEEQVVASTMKVVVEGPGKLLREEDQKEVEDTSAPAWGNIRHKESDLNAKKFPTLAKSVQSTNINIDDGRDPKINIETSKNVFAALENELDSDEEGPRRAKEIKPARIQKKKGESEKDAVAREVLKHTAPRKKKKEKKEDAEESDNEDEESQHEEDEKEEKEEQKIVVKKKKKIEVEKTADPEEEPEEELDDDVKIVADLTAAAEKYSTRRKPFPPKPLSRSELQEPKAVAKAAGGKPVLSKKKKCMVNEEEFEKKIAYWED